MKESPSIDWSLPNKGEGNMYRFFYNHEATGDVLFLLLSPNDKADKVVRKDDVAALYKGDKLIGVNFFDIGKTMKIHASGMIRTPGEPMLDCVNTLLSNAGLPTLEPLTDSGYKVMQVTNLEEHPLDSRAVIVTLTDGVNTFHSVYHDPTLKVNDKVVVAMPGCIAYDGTLIEKAVEKNLPIDVRLCTEKQLKISDNDGPAFKANEEKVGSDFFYGE